MDVGILGELAVWRDGSDVVLARLTKRTLAMLIADRDRVVSDDDLIDRLWDDDPPPHAVASLRNSVTRLRKVLPDGAIVRSSSGYRLTRERVVLDIDRFDDLVGAARRSLAAGEPDLAIESLDAALGLVRGEPLEDVRAERWASSAARELAERIALAEELWAEVRLRSHQAGRELARLHRAALSRPEREIRWHQLMQAYAQAGRRTEALRAASEARQALAEFGMVPGPEIIELEQRILGIDAATEPRRAGPVAGEVGRTTAPIIDRANDLARCQTSIDEVRHVTLVGLGGVGKTRLALEIAHLAATRLGRVAFADLVPVGHDEHVALAVADALGLADGDTTGTPLERVSRALGDQPALLVIDNAEHVPQGVRVTVEHLLARCSQLRILVTSRRPTGAAGEVAMTLDPLRVPASGADPAAIESAPAVQMLRTVAPGMAEDASADLARIARCVDGLPLALELVGRMLHFLSPGDIADQLERRGTSVVPHDADRAARQRSVEVVTEWAVDQLTPTQRTVFERTSVLAGPFTLATAEQIADAGDLDEPVILSLLRLAELSLMTADHRSSPGSYRHRVLPREHGRARLARAGTLDETFDRQVRWFVTLASDQGRRMRSSEQADARRLLEAEWDNVRDLLNRLPERGRWAEAADIAAELGEFWFVSGRWSEGADIARRLLATSPGPFGAREARLCRALAESTGTYGGVGALGPLLQRAVDYLDSEDGHDVEVLATCELYLAVGSMWRGEGSAFRAHLARAEELACTHRLDGVLASIPKYTGLAAGSRGDLLTARSALHESKRRFLALGNRARAANTLLNLGMFLQRHGDADAAEVELRDCMRLADGLEMRSLETHVRYTLGQIAAERGDADADLALLVAREELRTAGDVGCRNGCNRHLAALHRSQGRETVALSFLRESVEDVVTVDDQELAMSLVEIAAIYGARGRAREAAAILATARRLVTGRGIGLNPAQRARLDELEREVGVVDAVEVDAAVALALA